MAHRSTSQRRGKTAGLGLAFAFFAVSLSSCYLEHSPLTDDAGPIERCDGSGALCESPPAPTCADATMLRTYASPGACERGICAYRETDTECAQGCEAGACVTCSTWRTTTVDARGDCGSSNSLFVDDSGTVHVLYRDLISDELRYARGSLSESWTSSVIESLADPGFGSSLAVDALGGVHVAYSHPATRAVRYGYLRGPGEAWATSVLDTESFDPSLVIDPSGALRVVHAAWFGTELRHARLDPGGSWAIEVLESEDPIDPVLVADASGGLHVVYVVRIDQTETRYGYLGPDGSWTVTTIDSAGYANRPSLAVDAIGGVHVAYRSEAGHADRGLYYAYRSGDSWISSRIDPDGIDPSIAATATGVHVAYASYDNEVRYAHRDSEGSWTVTTVDDNATEPALVVDASGAVHVTYYDTVHGDLRYASRHACP